MKAITTEFAGLLVLQPKVFADARGSFVKTYHEGLFRELGIHFAPREEFFSVSRRGVVRGMHFQTPPMAQAKVVFCLAGSVLDVVVDLRKTAPTFGRSYARELSAASREILFIPVGFAHGFVALTDDALMYYLAGEVHSPQHDAGIRWDSFGFDWPVKQPSLSERDLKFPTLADFASPFRAG